MKFKTFFFVLILAFTTVAQTVSGRLGEFETNANPFDDELLITLQIKLDENQSSFLGQAFNLKFDFDTTVLQFQEGIYLNFEGTDGYETTVITNPGGSHTIQNISSTLISGPGVELTDQWTDYVLFKFTIIDLAVSEICPHPNANGFHFYSPGSNLLWDIGEWTCYEFYTPVELTSFTATVDNSVILNWATATELNNSGFEVQRNEETIGFVDGNGSTTYPCQYTYTDNPTDGTYTYRLKQVDFDGAFAYSNEIEVDVNSPSSFILEQNYPNPFNGATVITYRLNKPGTVNLTVYDALGREVQVLVNGLQEANIYSVDFHSDTSSNVYFYRLDFDGHTVVKKMTVLR